MSARPFQFAPLGDGAVLVTMGDRIDEATRRLVYAVSERLHERPPEGMIDQVPAFISVAVHYDPAVVGQSDEQSPYARMVHTLEQALAGVSADTAPPARVVEIPVCYGGELGPDLDDVARAHSLSLNEVIRIHVEGEYVVHMVGFMPGFAYLGGLAEGLVTPRRATPRTAVPAGTVGIGGEQTGVYPLESPGGWNLIGRTPIRVFDIERDEPALLATGDRVRFRPIERGEYDRWPAGTR